MARWERTDERGECALCGDEGDLQECEVCLQRFCVVCIEDHNCCDKDNEEEEGTR